jgi:hypothetical protein
MNSIVNEVLKATNPYPYRKQKCCICGKPFTGYGNNPAPIAHKGRCCDSCNEQMVIPSRFFRHSLGLNPRG